MKKLLMGCILGLSLISSSFAQESTQSIATKLKKEYPNLAIDKITYLPEVKLYEVRIKGNNALNYVNANLDYFLLNGQIIDPKNQKNISTERDMVFIKDFVKGLPYDKSISVKFGTGERRVAIFTDPDCPYCKATDHDINDLLKKDNITFSYFMNPLNIPGHEEAPLKARKIWCEPDRAFAWKNWMLNGVLPNNPGTCANPVDDTKKLAASQGFTLTPILVFDNGFIWRGQISAEQIRQILAKGKP